MVASPWRLSSATLVPVRAPLPRSARAIDSDHDDPYPSGRSMTATAGTTSPSSVRLAPGFQLGDFRVSAALWPLRIADAYRAAGPSAPTTLYVVHAAIAQHAAVRDHVIAGTRA